jgi:hypothetical protein
LGNCTESGHIVNAIANAAFPGTLAMEHFGVWQQIKNSGVWYEHMQFREAGSIYREEIKPGRETRGFRSPGSVPVLPRDRLPDIARP